jgi:1-acyl-sn-glycerol-3-phosphate acyltransferase
LLVRFIFFCCVKIEVINAPSPNRKGSYILACTHLSHLEAVCVSAVISRRIDWMVRFEFYRFRIAAWFWKLINAFSIRRRGATVRGIRTAIERARSGRLIGVFPEGGVSVGAASVCRGGAIKSGVCLISSAAQVPIVPVVILGIEKLLGVRVWLPFRRGRIWINFGDPIPPPAFMPGRANAASRRRQRAELNDLLARQFAGLYQQLRQTYGIDDRSIP